MVDLYYYINNKKYINIVIEFIIYLVILKRNNKNV